MEKTKIFGGRSVRLNKRRDCGFDDDDDDDDDDDEPSSLLSSLLLALTFFIMNFYFILLWCFFSFMIYCAGDNFLFCYKCITIFIY